MATNHHIYLITQISFSILENQIKNNDFFSLLPESYRNDFECILEENSTTESSKLLGRKKIIFCLKKEYLKNVHSFLIEALKMSKTLYKNEDSVIRRADLNNFIEILKEIEIPIDILYSTDNKKLQQQQI